MHYLQIVLCLVLCRVAYGVSRWDFAVVIKDKIVFYNESWSEIAAAAHQFKDLSAITYDEREDKIYFTDKSDDGSIFSLKLSEKDRNHFIDQLVSRIEGERVGGLAYDILDQALYWTDMANRRIYRMYTKGENRTPEILLNFTENAVPDGIAIDICRRKLYWTTSYHKNPTIESSYLDGSNRKVLVNKDLFKPHGITVDQFTSRIYWVVDQEGEHFSVESAKLDGSDREIVVKGQGHTPFSIAITKKTIYWSDVNHMAVWNASKTETGHAQQVNFTVRPQGIFARTDFLWKMNDVDECKDVVRRIKSEIKEEQNKNAIASKIEAQKQEVDCLNGGIYNMNSGTCICKPGFTGEKCESDSCHNYCVHGTCTFSSLRDVECICQDGFMGARCETYKCHDYCLNNGRCEIFNSEPMCHCPDSHSGLRCENNSTESCLLYCKLKAFEPDTLIPPVCQETCEDYGHLIKSLPAFLEAEKLSTCTVSNKTIIILVISVLVGLMIVLLIVESIRRMKKPLRPRIKKTFVVQKKISQTPLTSRPVATEQCEITIEDCCNMNICETPCFDPKLLQQNIAYDSCKEDKKVLINSMEEDLY